MAAGEKTRVNEKTPEGATNPPGYRAIPIKFTQDQASCHFLYVKQHRVRGGAKSGWPSDRTLFVLNVPPYCSEGCLAQLFSACGPVQSVSLHEKPDLSEMPKTTSSEFFSPKSVPGFQVAYVVFRKPASVPKAVALPGPLIASTESHPVKTGIEKWIADYADSLVDPEALRVEVDKFMEEYDKKAAEEDAKAEAEEGVPDEEGWVKVTRKGRRPGLPRSEAASLRVLEKEKRKKARKELLNFYAWQHRETKMEHLAQLRKKFEEDKQRIALMRAQRKFRPY
ncbi:ribosomal RNA-processing protein 7 homolog A [Sarcophilus harrisii]|uniref:ribosomal RNA-processing protein 7 homolog A n=1 Tax=Sarcophilus harrisii TaxID=9305 RepID=UPI000C7B6992|nr:ribosomal RNA-processing protein 7 homolog A [Sarcophilus harrisii]